MLNELEDSITGDRFKGSLSGSVCVIDGRLELDVDKLREVGYSVLTFRDGAVMIVPVSCLPDGDNPEGTKVEITIRRV